MIKERAERRQKERLEQKQRQAERRKQVGTLSYCIWVKWILTINGGFIVFVFASQFS